MKCMVRNKVPFHYALYREKEELPNAPGQFKVVYSRPLRMMGNVSPARGEANTELFGRDIQYDKVIVLEDPNCPIDEQSVLFIDKRPEFDTDGNPLFDYIVKRSARSLNSVAYAVSKVR